MNDGWAQIQPIFDKILKSSNHFKETGLVRVQYARKPNSHQYNTMKVGKLSWNEQSDQKWNLFKSNEERLFEGIEQIYERKLSLFD